MENETPKEKTERHFATLGQRLDELIRVCEQLALENQSLRAQQEALMAERDELIEQYEQARNRIEAIVARLRGLEQAS